MLEGKQKTISGKFSGETINQDKKQARIILFWVWFLVLLAVGMAILSRELSSLKKKVFEGKAVISERKEESPTVTPVPRYFAEKQVVEEMIKMLRGKYGIWFEDLGEGTYFDINGREVMTAASLIKLPVMVALYREAELGRINLDEVYRLKDGDKVGGAGSLQYKPIGFEVSWRKMAELMGKQSDNTAFNIVVNKLGKERIQDFIDKLGMRNTSLTENLTTPEDIALFWRKLYKEDILYDKDKKEILDFLTNTIWEDRIPAGVPVGVRVAHKIGTEVGVISDAGIVFGRRPFLLVIMSEGVNEIEAKKILPEITRKIYEMTQ